MKNIFSEHNIYPHEGTINRHFQGVFDCCYISLMPFIKIDDFNNDTDNFKSVQQITWVEAKKQVESLNALSDIDANIADIYTNNEKYPNDNEIYETGIPVSWNSVVNGSGLISYPELNKALRTSIGALRAIFKRYDLVKKLEKHTTKENIWHPTEGTFSPFSKISIYETFKLLKKNKIVITDEFYEKTSTIDLSSLSSREFSEKIEFKDYYIYSEDKEILFAIDWDSFFFVIATDCSKMNEIISKQFFEGFICEDEITHDWDYYPGEIDNYIKLEKLGKRKKSLKLWFNNLFNG